MKNFLALLVFLVACSSEPMSVPQDLQPSQDMQSVDLSSSFNFHRFQLDKPSSVDRCSGELFYYDSVLNTYCTPQSFVKNGLDEWYCVTGWPNNRWVFWADGNCKTPTIPGLDSYPIDNLYPGFLYLREPEGADNLIPNWPIVLPPQLKLKRWKPVSNIHLWYKTKDGKCETTEDTKTEKGWILEEGDYYFDIFANLRW
jgi:hypothetical protein